MDTYVAPLITLLGVLIVALIGFYQWRKKRQDDDQSSSRQSRRKAHQDLWLRLEEVNIKIRDKSSNPTLFTLLREVNEFFLRNSLWFADDEQKLVNEYVKALDNLRVAVYDEGGDDVVHAYMRTWFEVPEDVSSQIKEAEEQVRRLRMQLKTLVKREA